MFFERIFHQLNEAKIKYLVIGGVAVNLHGFPRMTGDLDLLISMDPANVKKFILFVRKLGWKPRMPVKLEAFADAAQRRFWTQVKGMKVFTVYNPKDNFEQIDVMIEKRLDFARAYRDRTVVATESVRVPIASIRDLIRLKKIAGRKRDEIDIEALNELRKLSRD